MKRCAPFVAKMVALSGCRVCRALVRDAADMIQGFVLPTIGKTTSAPSTSPTATTTDPEDTWKCPHPLHQPNLTTNPDIWDDVFADRHI